MTEKLREAAAELVRIMVTRRHSDLCQQGRDCVICDAICDINTALTDSGTPNSGTIKARFVGEAPDIPVVMDFEDADAPLEPTEEMRCAWLHAWDEIKDTQPCPKPWKDWYEWAADVTIRAVLAAAQPDTAHEEGS